MGKPTASCFRIIACGSGSVNHHDLQSLQSKASNDRHGWSFRKRYAGRRVLSKNVISELPSSATNESSECKSNLIVPVKTSAMQLTKEKNKLSAQLDLDLSDVIAATEDDFRSDAILNESSTIIIQAAIRRCLAHRLLLKQKKITKLQAVVRGYLVRRQAVGTLQCVQAIVKMQTLVRARRARLLVEGSGNFEKKKENSGKDNLSPTPLRSKREAKSNETYTYTSTEKLLSSKFACQLMESIPRTRSINIKCEPSKPDSTWNWLERWMLVSLAGKDEPQESGSAAEQHGEEDSNGSQDILGPSNESRDFSSAAAPSAETSEDEDNLIICNADNLYLHACSSIPSALCHHKLKNIDESKSRYEVAQSGCIEIEKTELSKVEMKYLPEEEETGNEQIIRNSHKSSLQLPETDAKKFSQEASNPSFIAAQSKFKQLSSAVTYAKSTSLTSGDSGVASSFGKVSVLTDPPFRSMEIGMEYTSISNASAVQAAGSECGTELSISSTLDSPDRSEAGATDLLEVQKNLDATYHSRSRENLDLEANEKYSILETELSYANISQLERDETVDSAASECGHFVIAADSTPAQKKLVADESNLHVELGSDASHQVHKSSPEASPRSHMTFPESQATPSSQVPVKPKETRGEESESNSKHISSSADKRFPLTPNHDSASRSSLEHRTGKRLDSFVLAKPDHVDQELRDSSSRTSLPSYMQATESARAKAISNGSPRSSPDVPDKDTYIKNKHPQSGRQGSPHIHRPLSQAQQNAKGNGIHSPQEWKWRH
ncbi:protein IQ-DOMAIN 32-like [Sesamum indicum]|uniref:Protein IQ-DOMAIN 32-like n=1 Tax=Sesamum indicum TaxID=4182 RepID=A0A6I9SXE4_SESIN|nr:protein IQ-DOMAIN 32-like [Sesamum indicum]